MLRTACRVLVVLVAAIAVMPANAEWYEAAGGSGDARVAILEQSAAGTTFEVTIPGFEAIPVATDSGQYQNLSIRGAAPANLGIGRPDVPALPVLLAIPKGAQVTVRVEEKAARTLKVGDVCPQQPTKTEGSDGRPFECDREFYKEDVSYPSSDYSEARIGEWRDLEVAHFQVYPLRVNPARGEVEVTTRLRVRVEYAGGVYPTKVADWMAPQYGMFIANYPKLPVKPQTDFDPAVRYLVISHSNYASDAFLNDSLLGWIRQRGFRDTRVISKSSYTQQEVRDSIHSEYYRPASPQLRWVLLVGQETEVPMATAGSEGDARYACVDGNSDPWPDVGVARLCPQSISDLHNQIRKALDYQRDPRSTDSLHPYDWVDSMHFVSYWSNRFSNMVRWYNDSLPYDYYAPDRDTIMGRNPAIGNWRVAQAINNGTGVVMYRGEGNDTCWYNWAGTWPNNQDWRVSDVYSLSNGPMTPVVYNLCCRNCRLSSGLSLGEAWMSKYPGGAVATIGYNDIVATEIDSGMGECLTRATTAYWTLYADSSGGYRRYDWPDFDFGELAMLMWAYASYFYPGGPGENTVTRAVLLGEPAMPIWAGGVPVVPTVTYPSEVRPWVQTPLAISVLADGEPVTRAVVCLRKDDESYYEVAVTNTEGIATFVVTPQTLGSYEMTVSEGHARHYDHTAPHTPILPYEGTIRVCHAPGWTEMALMPVGLSGKRVKAGGWLAYDPTGSYIWAAKGNKTNEFYRHDPALNAWAAKAVIRPGTEGRLPSKGCRGAADGSGHVYMAKGNNSVGFWRYVIAQDSWCQMPDVPLGTMSRKVKDGSDMVYVTRGDTGFVYLLGEGRQVRVLPVQNAGRAVGDVRGHAGLSKEVESRLVFCP